MADSPRRNASRDRKEPFRWVRDRHTLAQLGEQLRRAPSHAFDSESNSGFAYRERLCLLQFNVAERLWLVDLVAFDDPAGEVEVLREPLESARHTTWIHGGEFDVGSLKRDFGISLGGVWDTQQAATFLGWERTGYGAVVERVCGIELDKAYAHYDWSRRPVAEAPLRYALDDVRYLPGVAAGLEREVEAAGLTEELAVANEAVMAATWSSPSAGNGIWRLKGVHKLDESQLPRLVALWEWREAEASRRDVPPGRLMHPEKMMALARRPPRTDKDLRAVGLRGRSAKLADDLLAVLEHARAHPPRVPTRPIGPRQTPGEAKRLKKLKEWRRREAERREVPTLVVLPPTAMQHLARFGAGDLGAVPQLGSKRIALYGATLKELCR
jgi:ribonuclease D